MTQRLITDLRENNSTEDYSRIRRAKVSTDYPIIFRKVSNRRNRNLSCASVLLTLGILIFGLLCFSPTPSSAIEDAIIAIVNDEVITLKDLHDFLDSIALQLKLEGKSPSHIKKVMAETGENSLKRLIEDKLIISEANRKGMEIRKEFIDAKIESVKSKYTSEEAFLTALLAEGATMTDFRNKAEDQLKVKYLIESDVRAKIHVNPQEVTDYYNAHPDEFHRPDRVNLDSIYISHSGAGGSSQAQEKAKEALALLRQGKEFLEVAAEYSEKPSVGVIARGQLLPEIEKTVFNLRTGDTSPIVAVEDAFCIFKMNGKIAAVIDSLEQAKDSIYNKLFHIKFRKRFEAWLDKLKKDAFIEIKE